MVQPQDIILDSIADGVFTVDASWRITSFNRAAERITGVPRALALGKPCREVLKAEVCERSCCLRTTMETGLPIVNKTVHIVNADGLRVPISISTALLRDDAGCVIGAVETFRDLSVEENLRKHLQQRYSFADIVSKSHRMQKLFDVLPDVAQSVSTVLLEGESGTGKELLARAIHHLSPRRNRPFVVVNCAALPDTLLESELFGYKAGAFTDARKDKPGRFKLADRGTIFLDEIGDISPAMQVRLLRVLQERTVEPLGGIAAIPVDVRILAATNRSLKDLVASGKFREDLYYRINVVCLTLPPLRERREDIPLLIDHFIRHFNTIQGKHLVGVSPEALSVLMSHSYPGNIRELENIVERAFILCKGEEIGVTDLPEGLAPGMVGRLTETRDTASLRDLESSYLKSLLVRNSGNRQKTARQLGIHKTTLYRKMKKLGIPGE